ncbi:hypothetical protein STEG23_001012, partial [Scotinomys teguina]
CVLERMYVQHMNAGTYGNQKGISYPGEGEDDCELSSPFVLLCRAKFPESARKRSQTCSASRVLTPVTP